MRNLAKIYGGGVFILQSILIVEGTWFHRNFATWEGGAIYCVSSVINITSFHEFGMIYSHNFASRGGALLLRNSTASFCGTYTTSFKSNTAKIGGGLFVIGNSRVSSYTRFLNFTGSTAVAFGGAIHCENAYLTLGDSYSSNHYFSGNKASRGAAIHFTSSDLPKVLLIKGSIFFADNTVKGSVKSSGGAIYIFFSHFALTGSANFVNNEAYKGGGLYTAGCNVQIHGVLIFPGIQLSLVEVCTPNLQG